VTCTCHVTFAYPVAEHTGGGMDVCGSMGRVNVAAENCITQKMRIALVDAGLVAG